MAKNLRATFFKDDRGIVMLEIAIVGDPSAAIVKPTDAHKEQFAEEWAVFSSGKDEVSHEGTPLTDVMCVGKKLAAKLKANDIHTAEQLAAVHDGGLDAVGMSAYTHRQNARELLGLVPEPTGAVAP